MGKGLSTGWLSTRQKELENLARQRSGDGGKLPYYYFKNNGSHTVRIAPPWCDIPDHNLTENRQRLNWINGGLGVVIHQHQNIPGLKRPPTCLKRTYLDKKLTCPFCEIVEEIRVLNESLPEEKIIKLVSSYGYEHRINARGYTNLLIRDGSPDDADHHHWCIGSIPISVFNWLIGISGNTQLSMDLTDPEAGYDVLVIREGQAGTAKGVGYSSSLLPDGKRLHPDPEIRKRLQLSRKEDKDFGLFDMDTIFKFSETKQKAVDGDAATVRAALGLKSKASVIVTDQSGEAKAKEEAKATKKTKTKKVAKPKAMKKAELEPEPVVEEVYEGDALDPDEWVDVEPTPRELAEYEDGEERPICFSGFGNQIYLNSEPIAVAREAAGKEGKAWLNVPKMAGVQAIGCFSCPHTKDCSSITQQYGGLVTPGE
jgi:hypothetical protein